MNNKKKMIIGLLCFTLVVMGAGFAILQTSLNITGTSTASETSDVIIKKVLNDGRT